MDVGKLAYFRQHSKERAWERYRFDLTDAIYDEWLEMVRQHQCIQIESHSDNSIYKDHTTIKLISYQGQSFAVYYNSTYDAIASVLPIEAIKASNKKFIYYKNKVRKERTEENYGGTTRIYKKREARKSSRYRRQYGY